MTVQLLFASEENLGQSQHLRPDPGGQLEALDLRSLLQDVVFFVGEANADELASDFVFRFFRSAFHDLNSTNVTTKNLHNFRLPSYVCVIFVDTIYRGK